MTITCFPPVFLKCARRSAYALKLFQVRIVLFVRLELFESLNSVSILNSYTSIHERGILSIRGVLRSIETLRLRTFSHHHRCNRARRTYVEIFLFLKIAKVICLEHLSYTGHVSWMWNNV